MVFVTLLWLNSFVEKSLGGGGTPPSLVWMLLWCTCHEAGLWRQHGAPEDAKRFEFVQLAGYYLHKGAAVKRLVRRQQFSLSVLQLSKMDFTSN
jgi:hypothetical protein